MAVVELSVAVRADLRDDRRWLRGEAGAATAGAHDAAIVAWMDELCASPERGTLRADVGAARRTRVFRRSVTMACAYADETVAVLRVFARGRLIDADAIAGTDKADG